MKEFNLDFSISMDEYADIQIYYMMRKSNIVKSCVIIFILGIIITISGILTGGGISGSWLLIAFPIPYLAYIYFKMKNVAFRMYKQDIHDWSIEFGKASLNIKTANNKKVNETPFELIKGYWKTRKYMFIFLSKKVYIAIPLRAFENEEMVRQIIDSLSKSHIDFRKRHMI